ncbi:MAG TPA: murein biosynthesis integral membrane protein MurJ [Bryobacteraceae bacterium]|nr:murein biosynthesis integral membrane protein MurJ [Bryobacteraceae bacterium]
MSASAGGSAQVVRSAGVVSAAVSVSRVTGLVRHMVMARLFGAGAIYDAFLLGFRIPNLTRDLFAEGALSAAFVPVFTQYLSTKGRREAAELSNLVATALLVVVGVFCVLGMVFSRQLVWLLAPGFAAVPGKFALAVSLTRVMFPFLLLVALAAQAMAILNACHRFGVPALASTWFNLGSVGFGLLIGYTAAPRLGMDLVTAMACGVVLGGVLQVAWQAPSLRREGFSFQPRVNLAHPGLRRIFSMLGPAVIANAAVQVNILVNTNFASAITDAAGRVINGPVSWLSYAFRFLQLPLGLFGSALAAATLPAISRSVALGRMDEYRQTLAQSLGMVLLLTIPSAVGLAILGESMIGVVFQWGRFREFDTHQTAHALAAYAVGLAGYAATKILTPAFYALDDARTPMLVSVVSMAVNLGAAIGLVKGAGLGHVGLALATSAVALFSAAILFLLLRARLGYLHGRKIAASAARILAASAAMGVVCLGSSRMLHAWVRSLQAARFADVAVSIPLGLITFVLLCRGLRVAEVDLARQALLGARAERGGAPRSGVERDTLH